MNPKLNQYSNWQSQMYEILDTSHPYLLRDKDEASDIIVSRGELAYKEYLRQIDQDVPVLFAEEEARKVLLSGLEWSPTDFLGGIYYREFKKELSKEERVDLYFKYKDIFDKYEPSELFDDPILEEELREVLLQKINQK